MLKKKRGGLPDGIFIIVAFFFLAVIFLLVFSVISTMNTEFQAGDLISSEGKSMSADLVGRFPQLFDRIFLFCVVGLIFGVVAGAFFIPSHPALFWFSVPLLAFIIWLGGLFANIYWEISTHAELSAFADSFPITTFVFQHFVILITMAVLSLAAALYAKSRIPQ